MVSGGGINTIPNQFSFPDIAGASLSTSYSGSITISGMSVGTSTGFTFSGSGTLYKNGINIGTSGSSGTGGNNDVFKIQITSSPSGSTTHIGTFILGSVSDSWSVTTTIPVCT
jgi:hypothetical protein